MSHISGQKAGGPWEASRKPVSAIVAFASIHPKLSIYRSKPRNHVSHHGIASSSRADASGDSVSM
jgi:hypothetical protein